MIAKTEQKHAKLKNISIEKYPQAYLHYAVQLQKFKRYEKAIEILKALIEKFPEDMHHYATLALTTEFQNDDENAEKRYLNMLSKFPFYQNGHLLYGMFLNISIILPDCLLKHIEF